jgi:putative CocE/NonD family hydrolase
VNVTEKELRWLDHYVKGEQNGAENDAPVELFVMGAKEWRKEKAWPPSYSRATRFFLRSEGGANSSDGNGVLSPERPAEEAPDRFDYDPANPVPTQGGGTCCNPQLLPWGAMDQRNIEQRLDVLVYSTPPFDHDIEVTGPVEVHLSASSSAQDTDWTAKLVDVAPNGFAMNLTDGILRARYRNSLAQPEPLEAGKAYEFVFSAGNTSNVFLRGHRIRLEISSSNFPRFSRNTNTGNVPEKDRDFSVAHQTVYHDRARASYILLPIRATAAASASAN